MSHYPPVSPYAAGLGCKCPRCGEGNLYNGYLSVAERCGACELDYSAADSGDGPAVFVIFIVGFLAVAAVFVLRFGVQAPAWLSLVIGIILALALVLLTLRPLKATLIALQYRHRAAEGRLDDNSGNDTAAGNDT